MLSFQQTSTCEMQQTPDLRGHLEELQKRNRLLKELRNLQQVDSVGGDTDKTYQLFVKNALQAASETGMVTNVDLERIVLQVRSRPTDSRRRPLATTDVNQGPRPQPRIKLKLSEIPPVESRCHSARESSTEKECDVRNVMPATARESQCTNKPEMFAQQDHNSQQSLAPDTTRYEKLLVALNLERNREVRGPPISLGSANDQLQNEKCVSTRPRCHSAPVIGTLEAETKAKLAAQGEPGKWTLPGSPRWTDDINPSHQPDGEFSHEKRAAFERGVKTLLRNNRFGSTLLETKVEAKRSKHTTAIWGHERNETRKAQQFRTNMWKSTVHGQQAQCGRPIRRRL